MLSIKSFFDENYQTPAFYKEKQLSRRVLLKSAAGMGAVCAMPSFSLSAKQQKSLEQLTKTDPWLTLDATLNQLLPESATGPSAEDINATAYLHQVMTVQPTEQDEKDFILKGVGWLNGFSQSQQGKLFVQLSINEKEKMLRGISNSRAGENWLTTLLAYLFEAMLAPPAYGGNPNGIGWQWLDHQAGFPMPKKGQRYFELPPRSQVGKKIAVHNIEDKKISIKKSSKA